MKDNIYYDYFLSVAITLVILIISGTEIYWNPTSNTHHSLLGLHNATIIEPFDPWTESLANVTYLERITTKYKNTSPDM